MRSAETGPLIGCRARSRVLRARNAIFPLASGLVSFKNSSDSAANSLRSWSPCSLDALISTMLLRSLLDKKIKYGRLRRFLTWPHCPTINRRSRRASINRITALDLTLISTVESESRCRSFPLEDFGVNRAPLSDAVRDGDTAVLTADGRSLAQIVPIPEFGLASIARMTDRNAPRKTRVKGPAPAKDSAFE